MPDLFLLRHCPGAGSTTTAKALIPGCVISADDYFYQPSSEGWRYEFNPALIRDAHRQCLTNTEAAMRLNLPKIAVTNTFTRQWEFQPYHDLAHRYGYRVHSLIIENRHRGQNQHGVPALTVKGMRDRFEVSLAHPPDGVCSVCWDIKLHPKNKTGICTRCQQNKRAHPSVVRRGFSFGNFDWRIDLP